MVGGINRPDRNPCHPALEMDALTTKPSRLFNEKFFKNQTTTKQHHQYQQQEEKSSNAVNTITKIDMPEFSTQYKTSKARSYKQTNSSTIRLG